MLTVYDYFKKRNSTIETFLLAIKNHNTNFNTSYTFNPYYVLERINNREIRRDIIKRLLELNYDFKSPFPYDKLKDFDVLERVKSNLEKEFEYFMFYLEKGADIHSKDGLKVIVCKTEKKLTPFVFRVGYDMIINSFEGSISIILDPKYKKQFTLTNLYNKLNKKENVWAIWDKNMVVKTKEHMVTNVTSKDISKWVKEFNFKIE